MPLPKKLLRAGVTDMVRGRGRPYGNGQEWAAAGAALAPSEPAYSALPLSCPNPALCCPFMITHPRWQVRVSDARMSGTAYGTVVLHCSPEAAVGGPLALVRTGDLISLDVPARSLTLNVSDAELAARRAAWTPPAPVATRGYVKMYCENVTQAHEGADCKFLEGASGAPVPRESH